MMQPIHYRQAVPVRPGMVGRVACGIMARPERLTLIWKRVTCSQCRRTIAFEQAVARWTNRNVASFRELEVIMRIKRVGYAAWANE